MCDFSPARQMLELKNAAALLEPLQKRSWGSTKVLPKKVFLKWRLLLMSSPTRRTSFGLFLLSVWIREAFMFEY